MRRPLLLAALLFTIPLASASWSPDALTAEPSTPYDTPDKTWMDPDTSPGPHERVYLNGEFAQPNTFSITPHVEAKLGLWKDCNADGIVGNTAGETYLTILLFDTSICPPGSRHNDGSTVREFLHIGPGAPFPHVDDPDARLWADALVPGEVPAIAPKDHADDELVFDPVGLRWVGTSLWLTPPQHLSVYARVGPTVLYSGADLPSGGATFVYGAENCPFGVGWTCNPALWTGGALVGDVYHLRDVDCASASC